MFQVRSYDDPAAFRDRVLPALLEAEAENCRIISLAIRLAETGIAGVSPPPRLWTVESAGGIELVALQKSEALLEASRGSAEAADALVEALIADGGTSAITAPMPTAEAISSKYAERAKLNRKLHRRYRAHALSRVLPPTPVTGAMRQCDESDRQVLCNFIDAYMACINEPAYPDTRAVAGELISGKRILFWRDPHPVAMAAWAGPTPSGVRINFVYTPAEFRGRGYASNLVAALSQKLLDESRRSCFLFTDCANAQAEHIYARIGYEPVSDGEHWTFAERGDRA